MPDVFSTTQDLGTHVVLDYTSRDFTAIRSQLVGLARGLMPEWQTVGEASDFGTLLLELYSYMGDVLHFYIDRTASEAFLGTALRRQSVLYIADMLGYVPIGQHSAIVRLLWSLDANAEEAVTIPSGTKVYNDASSADAVIVFETDTELTLAPGDASIVGYATEGITHYNRRLGISTGSPNTELIIPDKGVVYGTLAMTSREGPDVIQWDFISDLSLARPTQSVFTTFVDEAEYMHVVFGDQAAGRIPPVNAEIFLTYRTGVGVEANLLAASALIKFQTEDSTVPVWGLSVTNPDPPVGGTDPESIDAMRNSIPRAATRFKNRAITLNDFADLAMQVPGVAKSMAYGTVYTSVHVIIAPTSGNGNDAQMDQLTANVERYLEDKVIVGSTVQVEPTSPNAMDTLWETVFIRFMVHVQDAYNRGTVRTTVEQALRQMLDFNNVDFGTRISIGSLYRMALSVQGVEWVDLFWLHTQHPGYPAANTAADATRITAENKVWNTDADPAIAAADRTVADIVPAETLIPKIDPTEVIEPNTAGSPWEFYTDEERTHDGLWIQAVGGLPGT